MMKQICKTWLVFLFFCSSIICAQEWQWANHYDFPGSERYSCIGGADKDGNLYVTVSSSTEYHNNNTTDYYLLKLDLKGAIVWSKKINEYMFGKIVTDVTGHSFIAASDKIVKFDNEGQEVWLVNTSGLRQFGEIFLLLGGGIRIFGAEKDGNSSRTFISTYNENGTLLSTVYDQKTGFMAIDGMGNSFFVSSEFPDPVTNNSARLRKYDINGTLIFEKAVPHYPDGIKTDADGNVFVRGSFGNDPIEIAGKKYMVPTGALGWYQYIIKYDSAGNLLWYKIIEGGLGNSNIALDKAGNLYYTINYFSEVRLNGLDIKNSTGTFLTVKFSPEGETIWHNIAGFSSNGAFSYAAPEQIYVKAGKEIYISGRIKETVQFGNISVQSTGGMYTQLFVSKLDQNDLVGLLENDHFENLWHVFPNPSGDIFSIRGETNDAIHISVTDTRGQLINSTILQGENKKIDLSTFAPGVYLLQIKAGDRLETRKIVKN